MSLLLYSNVLIGCLNTILIKDYLNYNVIKIIKKKLPSMVKDRIGAELKMNTDLVMLCFTTIPSTSNKLKNLVIN